MRFVDSAEEEKDEERTVGVMFVPYTENGTEKQRKS